MAEAAAYSRRGVLGGAKASTLSGDHNSSTTTLAGADLSTWAGAHTNGPICWTVNRGKADEEQGEATAVSGNSLTGVTRGLFGRPAQAHTDGATLELTSSKKDFDEANYTTAETVGKITTAGDVLVADGANSLDRLAIGTARQNLSVNSGATGLAYQSSMQSLLTAQGDIIYASAANTPARLAKGTASQVLTMNAGATAPEWASAATHPTALFIPAVRFSSSQGSPAESTASGWPVWLLDAAAQEAVSCVAGIGEIPSSWTTFEVDVWFTNTIAGAGDVVLLVSEGVYGDGGALNLDSSGANTTVAAPAQNVVEVSTAFLGVAVPAAAEAITLRVRRVADNGADTLAGDIGFLGVRLRKAS